MTNCLIEFLLIELRVVDRGLASHTHEGGSEVCNLHTEMMKFALLAPAAKNLAGVAENCR